MAKFRKKPVVIEAEQLRWDTWSEMCDFLGPEFFVGGAEEEFKGVRTEPLAGAPSTDIIGLDIPTKEGTMHASENDWIIRGVKGELYPCKPDIFEATYEAVDASS